MANYGVTNSTNFTAQNAISATYTPVIAVAASSALANSPLYPAVRRGKIYDILIGTDGTPADNYVEWTIHRITATTTGAYLGSVSSVSSNFALDVADNGFSCLAVVNASAASSTVFVFAQQQPFYIGINQRASYRWVAAPGSEIVWPATSSSGLSLSVRGSATVNPTANVLFQEQ